MKAQWGIYSSIFWGFYDSETRNTKVELSGEDNAIRAQSSMLNLMSRNKIYDVFVRRRGNVLYLERPSAGKGFREQIMERFERVV